jgi:hypothetical protein
LVDHWPWAWRFGLASMSAVVVGQKPRGPDDAAHAAARELAFWRPVPRPDVADRAARTFGPMCAAATRGPQTSGAGRRELTGMRPPTLVAANAVPLVGGQASTCSRWWRVWRRLPTWRFSPLAPGYRCPPGRFLPACWLGTFRGPCFGERAAWGHGWKIVTSIIGLRVTLEPQQHGSTA